MTPTEWLLFPPCCKTDLVSFLEVRCVANASGISTDPASWASCKLQPQPFALVHHGGQNLRIPGVWWAGRQTPAISLLPLAIQPWLVTVRCKYELWRRQLSSRRTRCYLKIFVPVQDARRWDHPSANHDMGSRHSGRLNVQKVNCIIPRWYGPSPRMLA